MEGGEGGSVVVDTNLVHFFTYPTRDMVLSRSEWRKIKWKRNELVRNIRRCQYRDKETPEHLLALFEKWFDESCQKKKDFDPAKWFQTRAHLSWQDDDDDDSQILKFQTAVIHYLLQATYEINAQDGEMIGKILRYLELIDYNFRFIMLTDDDTHSFPAVSDDRRHPTEYFLRHACQQRLVSTKKSGKRIAEVPICGEEPSVHAMWNKSPRLLLTLLQHKAGKKKDIGYESPGEYLMKKVYYQIEWRLKYRNVPSDQVDTHPATRDLVQCVRYILRVCSRFTYFRRKKQRYEKITKMLLTMIPHLIDWITQPLPLQHLCRLQIRDTLHENWQLPIGIDLLPIPQTMRNYINLRMD